MDGNGRRIPNIAMDPGTVGIAVNKDGTWKLIFVDELPEVGECDSEPTDPFNF
jgi:hypothetical protein